MSNKWNTVNPYFRLARGKPTVRKAVGDAGMRSRKKRTPACSGSDTKSSSARKGADFRVVFRNERAFGISKRRKANGRGPQDHVCTFSRSDGLGQHRLGP